MNSKNKSAATQARVSSQSEAQIIFSDKQLLVARPAEMLFEEYKFILRGQNFALKRLFRRSPSRRVAQTMPIRSGYNSPPHLSPLRLYQIAVAKTEAEQTKPETV